MRKGDENMEKKKEPSGIQKAWRQLSIQNQIFLSMFLITLLGVGVLMNIVYKTSIDAIEQNYRAYMFLCICILLALILPFQILF